MKSALLGLLGSKKVWTLIIGAVVYAAGKWGFAVNATSLQQWADAIMVLIGAQGVKDLGVALASKPTIQMPAAISATELRAGADGAAP